jgi:hypothetical protein
MKKCAYCTAENRDAAIFCSRCKRALPAGQAPGGYSLVWLLIGFFLIGLSFYLFSTRFFLPPAVTQTGMTLSEAAPGRTPEPLVLQTCVTYTAHIRRGPGTHYEPTGGLPSGMCLTILGRNEEETWVFMVSDDHQTGWVALSALPDAGDISRVSLRDDPAMANPARPTLTTAELAHGAKTYLTQVAATNLPRSSDNRYIVACFEMADRIGDIIKCKMEKAYCDYLPDVEGSPTFCSDRPAPDHVFALVVFGEDWSSYDGQCLLVSGYLEVDRGTLQIQALQPSQVSSCT